MLRHSPPRCPSPGDGGGGGTAKTAAATAHRSPPWARIVPRPRFLSVALDQAWRPRGVRHHHTSDHLQRGPSPGTSRGPSLFPNPELFRPGGAPAGGEQGRAPREVADSLGMGLGETTAVFRDLVRRGLLDWEGRTHPPDAPAPALELRGHRLPAHPNGPRVAARRCLQSQGLRRLPWRPGRRQRGQPVHRRVRSVNPIACRTQRWPAPYPEP